MPMFSAMSWLPVPLFSGAWTPGMRLSASRTVVSPSCCISARRITLRAPGWFCTLRSSALPSQSPTALTVTAWSVLPASPSPASSTASDGADCTGCTDCCAWAAWQASAAASATAQAQKGGRFCMKGFLGRIWEKALFLRRAAPPGVIRMPSVANEKKPQKMRGGGFYMQMNVIAAARCKSARRLALLKFLALREGFGAGSKPGRPPRSPSPFSLLV